MGVPSRAVAAAVAVLSVLALALPARADGTEDDKKKAARLFKEGRAAITAGKVDEACGKFEESFKLDAAIGTKLNLADCLERKGLLVAAYHLFDEAATEAARTSKEGRESFARTRADALVGRLVKLELRLAEPATPRMSVTIAGVIVAASAWGEPRFVEPGTTAIDVTAPGKVPFHVEVEGHGGDTKTIDVPALADGSTGTGPGTGGHGDDPVIGAGSGGIGTADHGPHRSRTLAYVTGGAGGALLIGSLVFGLAARSGFKGADCGDKVGLPPNVCTPDGQKTTDRARKLADIGTGFAIAGVVGVGVGVFLFLRGGHHAAARADHVLVTPTVSDDAVGVVVTFHH